MLDLGLHIKHTNYNTTLLHRAAHLLLSPSADATHTRRSRPRAAAPFIGLAPAATKRRFRPCQNPSDLLVQIDGGIVFPVALDASKVTIDKRPMNGLLIDFNVLNVSLGKNFKLPLRPRETGSGSAIADNTADNRFCKDSGHDACTSIWTLPTHIYTTPDTRCFTTAQPVVAQLMNCACHIIHKTYASNNNTEQTQHYTYYPCQIHAVKQAHIRTSNLLSNSYYKQGPSNADPQPAKPTQAIDQGPKHRKATAGSYEFNQCYSTPCNSAESSKQHKTGSEHLSQQARTEMLTEYKREMSSRTSLASSKRPNAISKRSVSARGVQRYHSYFNRSSLPSVIEEDKGPSNADPPPAKPTQAIDQGPKHRKATAGSYEVNQCYSTPCNSAESSKQHKTGSEHLSQQARTEMLTEYKREMSSRTSLASSKRPNVYIQRSVSARGVQRYHSYFNRSCLPSAIEEDKNRIQKGDVFAHLTSFKQPSERYIQTKRLSKRSPTLPLLLQSELSTIGN
ncbi:F-box/FBD/LRR-repeat protein [Dorcoceras hygrometricum]|uniref:F-box/FBD/LRR-repeat protein n=1 Tax=Dorcoceras hygrometricum TaxID=472368 RepID=A0A2Z7ATK5_9LAMI|nr:F-box/FBD/LRR-repeat protein [Dorcoceras hygrometricum]